MRIRFYLEMCRRSGRARVNWLHALLFPFEHALYRRIGDHRRHGVTFDDEFFMKIRSHLEQPVVIRTEGGLATVHDFQSGLPALDAFRDMRHENDLKISRGIIMILSAVLCALFGLSLIRDLIAFSEGGLLFGISVGLLVYAAERYFRG